MATQKREPVFVFEGLNHSSELKRTAHHMVRQAVNWGTLKRPDHCENCGEKVSTRRTRRGKQIEPLSAHHEDYAKPMEIVWLCRKCHYKRHFGRGKWEWGSEAAGKLGLVPSETQQSLFD